MNTQSGRRVLSGIPVKLWVVAAAVLAMALLWAGTSPSQVTMTFEEWAARHGVTSNSASTRVGTLPVATRVVPTPSVASRPVPVPVPPVQPPAVSEADFLRVTNRSCVRCHKNCASIDGMKQQGWIVPGKPDNSRAYTIIGVNRQAGGTYHNLSDADKKIVEAFITQMKG